MESKPADVFITYDPKDSARVEPWIIVLGAGGLGVWYDWAPGEDGKVKVAASRAMERSRLVIFFMSSASMSSDIAFQEVMLAQQMKKPMVVIALEPLEVADGWRKLLRDAPMIDIRQDGRRAAWEAMQQVLQERRLKWADPELSRPSSRMNLPRGRVKTRRWVTVAVLVCVVGSLAYFGFLRPRAPLPQTRIVADPEMAVALPETQLSTGDAAGKTAPVDEEPRLTPSMELVKPLDARQISAVEHVKGSIASACRNQSMDAEHIDKILSYFAEPAWLQDKGRQDKSGLKAYMKVRQIELPHWLELVESIDVAQSAPEEVLVSVRSSYLAETQSREQSTGVLNTRYTVVFSEDGKPAIQRVEGSAETR